MLVWRLYWFRIDLVKPRRRGGPGPPLHRSATHQSRLTKRHGSDFALRLKVYPIDRRSGDQSWRHQGLQNPAAAAVGGRKFIAKKPNGIIDGSQIVPADCSIMIWCTGHVCICWPPLIDLPCVVSQVSCQRALLVRQAPKVFW